MSQHTVMLAGETDSLGFRREARALLAALVAPDEVQWIARDPTPGELFATRSGRLALRHAPSHAARHALLPQSFISLCETVLLHSAALRFALLYRLLWRAVHEPGLLHDPLDADRVQALHMAQGVRRDMQKMKTLIDFRSIDDERGAEDLQLAWYEPEHHIVEAIAPFFVRRLKRHRWVILTPERSMRWDGEQLLEFGPGLRKATVPPTGVGDARWLACYRAVFSAAQPALCRAWDPTPQDPD
jgi:DNA polymerase